MRGHTRWEPSVVGGGEVAATAGEGVVGGPEGGEQVRAREHVENLNKMTKKLHCNSNCQKKKVCCRFSVAIAFGF